MKNFSNQYHTEKSGKIHIHFWIHLLQWLRLLVLSLNRIRKILFENFFNYSGAPAMEMITVISINQNKKINF